MVSYLICLSLAVCDSYVSTTDQQRAVSLGNLSIQLFAIDPNDYGMNVSWSFDGGEVVRWV